jgi:hypothetical protein
MRSHIIATSFLLGAAHVLAQISTAEHVVSIFLPLGNNTGGLAGAVISKVHLDTLTYSQESNP